jgi:hypothetical protein
MPDRKTIEVSGLKTIGPYSQAVRAKNFDELVEIRQSFSSRIIIPATDVNERLQCLGRAEVRFERP